MRHKKGYRKLGRESDHRRAMLRNMATSFLRDGKLKTTITRAKEVRPIVERMITLGKRGDLSAKKRLHSYLFQGEVVGRVCSQLAERFRDRQGGYTRIIRYGARHGDGAVMCNLELVDYSSVEGKVAAEKMSEKLEKRQAEQQKEAEERAKLPGA